MLPGCRWLLPGGPSLLCAVLLGGLAQVARAEPLEGAAREARAEDAVSVDAAEASQAVRVRVEACGALQTSEIRRVLQVELGSAGLDAAELSALRVEVQCGGEWIRLTLQQQGTGEYLDRLIPAPPTDDPGRERIVALAASQMIIAWLPRQRAAAAEKPHAEGAVQPPAPPAIGPGSEAQPTPAAAVAPIEPERPPAAAIGGPQDANVDTAAAPPHAMPAIWLRGGLRGAGIDGAATLLPGIGLGIRTVLLPSLDLLAGIELSHGSAERAAGRVGVTAGAFSVGLDRALLRSHTLSLQFGADVALGYLRLSGDPAVAFEGKSRHGATIDFSTHLGPLLHFEHSAVGVLGRAGWLTGGAEGLVAGGRPVSPDGLWLGASLELSLTP